MIKPKIELYTHQEYIDRGWKRPIVMFNYNKTEIKYIVSSKKPFWGFLNGAKVEFKY